MKLLLKIFACTIPTDLIKKESRDLESKSIQECQHKNN